MKTHERSKKVKVKQNEGDEDNMGDEGRNMFVTGVIDVELWNKATWRAVVVGTNGTNPPILGLAFKNKEAAKTIFRQWRKKIGPVDSNEEIHVSIIEGEIPGEMSGYSVHINTNVEGLLKRTKAQGLDISKDYIVTTGRFHRMNPDKNSRNLANFKSEFAKFKSYYLTPVVFYENGKVELIPELDIQKTKINFRHVEELTPDDFDYVVLKKDKPE